MAACIKCSILYEPVRLSEKSTDVDLFPFSVQKYIPRLNAINTESSWLELKATKIAMFCEFFCLFKPDLSARNKNKSDFRKRPTGAFFDVHQRWSYHGHANANGKKPDSKVHVSSICCPFQAVDSPLQLKTRTWQTQTQWTRLSPPPVTVPRYTLTCAIRQISLQVISVEPWRFFNRAGLWIMQAFALQNWKQTGFYGILTCSVSKLPPFEFSGWLFSVGIFKTPGCLFWGMLHQSYFCALCMVY